MPYCVADVVRQCTHRKREFIRIPRVAEKVDDEIAGPDIMGQVRKILISKGIVANVLNDASTIGISTRVLKLLWRQRGIAA